MTEAQVGEHEANRYAEHCTGLETAAPAQLLICCLMVKLPPPTMNLVLSFGT